MEKVKIHANTFIPMPVTLIGSMVEGKPNFMAAGWVTRINHKPPYLALGINKVHYTPLGMQENKSFSVNFPSADMVIETDYCGVVSGKDTDKSSVFELFYGELKTAPMIRKCPLCLECTIVNVYEMPTNNLFIGEIVAAYTEEKYLTSGRLDFKKMNLMILTMIDNNYWTIGEHVAKAWSVGRKMVPKRGE